MKKALPTYIHNSCTDLPHLYISAGVRGLQIKIAPHDLLNYTKAAVADLTTDPLPSER